MHRLQTQDGFSLLEVLVAIVILSIGMLGVGTLVITSMRQDHYTGRVRVAENFSQSKLEELRGKTADGALSNSVSPSHDYSPDKFFCRQWTIADPPAAITAMTGGRIKLVTVMVGWPSDFPKTGSCVGCCEDTIDNCSFKHRASAFIVQQ